MKYFYFERIDNMTEFGLEKGYYYWITRGFQNSMTRHTLSTISPW